jgi:hypothetical protein
VAQGIRPEFKLRAEKKKRKRKWQYFSGWAKEEHEINEGQGHKAIQLGITFF